MVMSIIEKLNNSLIENADAVVVEEGEYRYTYGQLRRDAYALAHEINRRGADCIAVIGEPSYATVVSLVGAVFSRAAYVPIDPYWPSVRALKILDKTGITTAVGSASVLKESSINLPALEIGEFIGQTVEKPCPTFKDGSSVCYIMYTSGSTDGPKGVIVGVEAFGYFLDWFSSEFRVVSGDRFAYISSIGFGASLRQVFSPILSGATAVCLDSLSLKNPLSLLDNLRERKITIFNAPPVVIKQVIDTVSDENIRQLSHLRYVLVGGDIFPTELLRKWYEKFRHDHGVVNLYGSTESIVNASFYKTTSIDRLAFKNSLPIGQPRPHLSFLILDDKNEPISEIGRAGILYIQSDVLAYGYYDDPQKTEETFVEIGGRRFYRTGDLVMRDENGHIFVVGRRDRQIQVYGNRVELNEIERTIKSHPKVEDASIVDFKDGDRHIMWAYAISEKNDIPLSLKRFLKERLPAYMIPYHIEFVDAIATNQSNKIDYQYLKKSAQRKYKEKYLMCKNEKTGDCSDGITDKIKAIWLEYIGRQDIDLDESFFDVGGDSVIAVEIYHVLCKEFDVGLDPFVFYNSPTIRALSQAIKEAKEKSIPHGSTPLPSVKEKTSFRRHLFKAIQKFLELFDALRHPYRLLQGRSAPLTAQQKFFFNTNMLVGQQINGCLIVPIRGEVCWNQLNKCLDLIVRSHDALRTIFVAGKQIIVSKASPELMLYDLVTCKKEELDDSISQIQNKLLYKKFDFSNLHLFNVALIKKSKTEFVMIFCANHIIADGWSIQIFFSALNQCYGFFKSGTPLRRVPSYIDYTLAYKKFCRERYHDNLRYWNEKNTNIDEYNSGRNFEEYEALSSDEKYRLTNEECGKIEEISVKYGASSFYIFMAMWARAVTHLFEVSKILFLITYHNRSFKFEGLQNMIGSVARMMPIYIDCPKEKDFKGFLEGVQRNYLESLERVDFNIMKYYADFADNQQKRNRVSIAFNYIDFRPLSRNLNNIPFEVDVDNCEILMSRDQNSAHPAYLYFSVHHYPNHIGLQAYGSCPKRYKLSLFDGLRGQVGEL